MSQQRLLYSILLLFFAGLTFCNRATRLYVAAGDKYNLSFSYCDSSDFVWIPYLCHHSMGVDSGDNFNGKYPLTLQQVVKPVLPLPGSPEVYDPMIFNYYQTIILPDTSSSKIQIRLNCKTQHIKEAYLRVICSDKEEKILCKDSILISSNYWKTSTLSVSSENAKLLNVAIYNGIDGRVKQKIWLDRMEILVDGKDINSFPTPGVYSIDKKMRIDNALLHAILPDKSVTIPLTDNKMIVALGESVHGSKSMVSLCYRIIKGLVENDSCKLILFELPIDECLLWNAYVLGQVADSTIKEMAENIDRVLLPVTETTNFLAWLREYNSRSAAKVRLAGVDDVKMEAWLIPLFDYIYAYYKPALKNELLPLLDSLNRIGRQINYTKIAELVEATSLKALLGEEDYEMLQHVLRQCADIAKIHNDKNLCPYRSIFSRDYTMFRNTQKAIDLYLDDGEKAAIVAHYGHINKKNQSPFSPAIVSLGYYLSEHYGSSYFPVGIFAGGGAVSVFHKKTPSAVFPLAPNPGNSIEQICMNTGIRCFYAPISALPDEPLLVRYIPNRVPEKQFAYAHLGSRIDGFIFIDSIESGESKDRLKISSDLMFRRDVRRSSRMHALKNVKNK